MRDLGVDALFRRPDYRRSYKKLARGECSRSFGTSFQWSDYRLHRDFGHLQRGLILYLCRLERQDFGWNPAVPPPPPSTQAQLGATGAIPSAYTGIALDTLSGAQYLYAANAAAGRVDVYDRTFANITSTTFAGKFVDSSLPAGLVPFNVANINDQLYVSYTPASPTIVGFGVINVFDTAGNFIKRFATGSASVPLYDPWGMAVAPSTFGKFANAFLVGDFNLGAGSVSPPNGGPGYILAFSLAPGPENGTFLGLLEGTDGKPLSIDGLWSLIFGNDGSGGNSSDLYFSAGINAQADGLFGSLSACHGPTIHHASATPNVLRPPNNKFVPVGINCTVEDDCVAVPACSLGVTVADSGGGINNMATSFTVVDAHTVELQASRNGGGNGRTVPSRTRLFGLQPINGGRLAQLIRTV